MDIVDKIFHIQRLKNEGMYLDSTPGNGEFKRWWYNGKLNRHGFHKNGQRHGEYKVWYENGKLWKHEIWDNGKCKGNLK